MTDELVNLVEFIVTEHGFLLTSELLDFLYSDDFQLISENSRNSNMDKFTEEVQ